MRIILATTLVLLFSTFGLAQNAPSPDQPIDPMDRYNARLATCADCFQRCAHRWDQRRLSKELKRTGARARRECEDRCAVFLHLGENECRGAYLGRTLRDG